MERLGRKGGGNWSGDAMEGMEALEGGQSDRALDAMQKALDKMRAMDEAQRSGKGLRGTTIGRFVVDTGAAFTTITPELPTRSATAPGTSTRPGPRRPAGC